MADAVTTNFAPIATTALASSAAGSFSAQPIGKAVAKLIVWNMSLHCSCSPPQDVSDAVGYLSVTVIAVGITASALLLHYVFLKLKG